MAKYDWNPWKLMDALDEETDRVLEGRPRTIRADCTAHARKPPANVVEMEDAFVLEIELPGIRRESIALEYADRELVVHGEGRAERETGEGVYHVMERRFGPFCRRFVLPVGVSSDHVSAVFADGLLVVTVAKRCRETPLRTRIPVSE